MRSRQYVCGACSLTSEALYDFADVAGCFRHLNRSRTEFQIDADSCSMPKCRFVSVDDTRPS